MDLEWSSKFLNLWTKLLTSVRGENLILVKQHLMIILVKQHILILVILHLINLT